MSCSDAAVADEVRAMVAAELLDAAGAALLETLGDGDSLLEAGLLDSLGVVQLVALLERRFGVVFEPLDVSVDNLESIDKIAALVHRRRGA